MKVIETRQVTEEVRLMSWSPKMDLIVMGSDTGEVFLHRLTWQRIWMINLNSLKTSIKPIPEEQLVPNLITWHPEGIFLSIASGKHTFIIDVESGQVVHNHEMPTNIIAMNWCSSKYDVSSDEAIAAQPRQQPDFLRTDLKIQRLESQLSVLLIATEKGLVHAYTGGFLIASIMQIPPPLIPSLPSPEINSIEQKFEILHVNATRDLESFVFLVSLKQEQQQQQQEKPEGEDQEEQSSSSIVKEEELLSKEESTTTTYLCFSHFRNEMVEKIAPVLGPLGFKYLFFTKNWSLIQQEFLNLQEEWSKLVDIYKNYMTYGNEKEFKEVRADYMELLFTGIQTVEMEIYLGKGGREKEVKRNTTTMNSIHGSMSDHLKNVKSALVFMTTELNELGGFLNQLARVPESDAKSTIVELRKSLSYLYLAALHIQSLMETFLDVFHDFIHLILNTIHLINIQESPDYNEEDADVEKILKFLDMKIEKNIFDFLLENAPIIFQKPPTCLEPIQVPKYPSMSKKIILEIERERKENPKKFPFIYNNNNNSSNSQTDEKSSEDWQSFPEFISEFIQNENNQGNTSFIGQDFILDFSQEKVLQLFQNLSPTIDGLMAKLFKIPVLCTLPFKAETFPISEIPSQLPSLQELQQLQHQEEEQTPTKPMDLRDVTGLLITTKSSPLPLLKYSSAYLIWDSNTIYLFDYNFTSSSPIIKAHSLNFSLKVTCSSFFCEISSATPNMSKNYLSVLTYDEEDGKSVLCQINLEKIEDKSIDSFQIDIKKFQNYAVHQATLNKTKESSTTSTSTTTTSSSSTNSISQQPGEVYIDIPKDVSKTSANINNCPCLDYAFPIEGFNSNMMAVSGARHVGAFMVENKKSILLLDMELEVPDTSYEGVDDDNTNSEFLSQTISEVTL